MHTHMHMCTVCRLFRSSCPHFRRPACASSERMVDEVWLRSFGRQLGGSLFHDPGTSQSSVQDICMHIHIYMYVCMFVCMYVNTIYIYIYIYIYMQMRMSHGVATQPCSSTLRFPFSRSRYVTEQCFLPICKYVCIRIWIHKSIHFYVQRICINISIYLSMYPSMQNIYIHIYIYMRISHEVATQPCSSTLRFPFSRSRYVTEQCFLPICMYVYGYGYINLSISMYNMYV